ncbi:bifunctional phosphoglucose/phosphomannose isomerase [Putridiphycobacter roseus]|uniref:Bifunctional phosphoglucose/phosphomannose isomerase n=1 Tax=Putridiphycobacter roseus TaxID=2219161 RepID=A0A2W1NN60_9FLAO|nr:bifunctional phosphoglucose/phosphomannose isomerase [Putridiphycobacter roseus]PZE17122.1 bifunctional phosphoglucose/phosphomannose isomerase [Putridiphycobacter roseus]
MQNIIADFPNQLKNAMEIGKHFKRNETHQINNILACGLGGSGIGAKIAKLLNLNKLSVPFESINDYSIPAFVNENTLVIATSYSGNTEETLEAIEKCKSKNAKIVIIASAGKLLELAKENNWPYIIVPGGEQPRAMLGYSLIQHFYVLKAFGLIDNQFENSILEAIEIIEKEESAIKDNARVVAGQMYEHTPVIYSNPSLEGIAIRFRQQINENSKMLCWHAVIPEMNHNELVGWAGGNDKIVVIKLKTDLEYYRTSKRWDFCKPVIESKTKQIIEINAKGKSLLTQALYLIHLTDWISLYLADLNEVDPIEVNVISSLKSKLSELK